MLSKFKIRCGINPETVEKTVFEKNVNKEENPYLMVILTFLVAFL